MARIILRVMGFLFPLFFAGFCTVYAQEQTPLNADFISKYGLRNLENALVLHADPITPEPGGLVNVFAESPIFDLEHDNIIWSVNGKTIAQGVGKTSISITADARGSTLNIAVSATDPTWGVASHQITLIPLQVDIVFEGPTYVPPFYRGRALPGAGGITRLQAITHFQAGGSILDDKDLVFTWSRNGKVMSNVSGRGISSISVSAPLPNNLDTISVQVTSLDESLSASTQVALQSTDVVLGLYEKHPLYGILFHQMLPAAITGPADISVSAIPYFATISRLQDPAIEYRWTLNNSPIEASSTKRNEISLSSEDSYSELQLKVLHAVNFFFSATGKWIFRSKTTNQSNFTEQNNDVFHSDQI